MKKHLLTLFLSLFAVGLFAQQVSFRYANPRVMCTKVGTLYYDYFEFDVQIKSSASGTYYFSGTYIFSFDNVGLTTNPANITITKATLINGLNTLEELPKYTTNKAVNGTAPNLVYTIGVYSADNNVLGNGGNPGDFSEIPTDWATIITVKARISNPTSFAGVDFVESSMNGQQSYLLEGSSSITNYTIPNLYDSKDLVTTALGRIYSNFYGWSQAGNTTNAQWVNWNNSVNTTVWEGTAGITQADGSAAMFSNLNLLNGATLNIAANKFATVTGNLTNTGTAANLTIATGGSLITNGTVTGEGSLSSTIPGASWHLVSMPVAGQTANNFFGEYLQTYSEPTNTWSYITEPTTPLAVGTGYATWASDKTYAGVFNTGNVTVGGLSYSGALRGFNLVGNPYPSGLNISSVWPWGMNLTNNTWVWDQTYMAGNYRTDVLVVAPGQGFFVQASDASGLIIPNDSRVHTSTGILKNEIINQLKLRIDGNDYADETFIRFTEGSTASYDFDFDCPKMYGAAEAPQLFTQIVSDNFTNLTRNVLPQIDGNDVVKMNLKVGAAGTYTITASDLESFTDDVTATLVDLQAGISQKLNDNAVYTFSAEPTDNEARFLIQFKSATGDVENDTYGIRIYAFNNQAYVDMPANVNGIVTVYDMVGKKLTEVSAHAGLNTIALNFNAANYLISVKSNVGTVNKQVFVK